MELYYFSGIDTSIINEKHLEIKANYVFYSRSKKQ